MFDDLEPGPGVLQIWGLSTDQFSSKSLPLFCHLRTSGKPPCPLVDRSNPGAPDFLRGLLAPPRNLTSFRFNQGRAIILACLQVCIWSVNYNYVMSCPALIKPGMVQVTHKLARTRFLTKWKHVETQVQTFGALGTQHVVSLLQCQCTFASTLMTPAIDPKQKNT